MKNILKRSWIALLPFVMAMTFGMNVKAASRLTDYADLLTPSGEEEVLQALDEVSEKYGMDVCVATVFGREGDIVSFTDDFYDERYSENGVILMIDMSDRSWYISTCGEGIKAFTDAGIDYIGEKILGDLADGYYAESFLTYARLCDSFIEGERSGTIYDGANMPKDPYRVGMSLAIALAVGVIVGFIYVSGLKSQLNTVGFNKDAEDYVKRGSFSLSEKRDSYIYSRVTKVRRESSSSSSRSGGGSSFHSSSSGRSHGGGGGHF
ncbi:MAG: TPM domain-containing protein [Lachnospiraceae bacterium]|nr:TPM domain-containing protein [Lachnospiraceae bacterium]